MPQEPTATQSVTRTQEELAKQLGTTARSVRNWIATGASDLPATTDAAGDPSFDVEAWRAWALTNGKLQGGGNRTQQDPGDAETRRQTNKLKAARQAVALELERMDLEERKGTLVRVDVVEDVLMDLAERLRTLQVRLQSGGHDAAFKMLGAELDQWGAIIRDRLKKPK
jgi:predicted transcriptional regulator